MHNYTNNPMMDMFKKSMEDPMAVWSSENWNKTLEMFQSSDMSKGFNPGNWMTMSNKFTEAMPWLNTMKKQGNGFADNVKNVEAFADMHKLSLESAQAMLRRQAEIIQKHSTDIYKLMQNMVSSPNPEAAMSIQAEYMHIAFDTLVADFKELVEMYSKSNLETFETASGKVSQHMHKMKASCCSKDHNHTHSHDGSSHSHAHSHNGDDNHDHEHHQESRTKKTTKK